MELSDSINFLSFLIIILIAVIVSKKARSLIRNFFEGFIKIISSIGVFLAILLFIGLFVCFLVWGWYKLHEICPRMWSLYEILGVLTVFLTLVVFLSLIEYIKAHPEINNLKFGKKDLDILFKKSNFVVEFKMAMKTTWQKILKFLKMEK